MNNPYSALRNAINRALKRIGYRARVKHETRQAMGGFVRTDARTITQPGSTLSEHQQETLQGGLDGSFWVMSDSAHYVASRELNCRCTLIPIEPPHVEHPNCR